MRRASVQPTARGGWDATENEGGRACSTWNGGKWVSGRLNRIRVWPYVPGACGSRTRGSNRLSSGPLLSRGPCYPLLFEVLIDLFPEIYEKNPGVSPSCCACGNCYNILRILHPLWKGIKPHCKVCLFCFDACRPVPGSDALRNRRILFERSELVRPLQSGVPLLS